MDRSRDELKISVLNKRIDMRQFLTPAAHGGFVCPECGNGSGQDGTGAVYYPQDNRLHCFRCNRGFDVIDAYMAHYGTTYGDALADLSDGNFSFVGSSGTVRASAGSITTEQRRDYLSKCAAAYSGSAGDAYLRSRGISTQTAQRYGVGFDPSADPAAAPYGVGSARHAIQRIIIPAGDLGYTARRIDAGAKYRYLNGGAPSPSDMGLLLRDGVVVVCEGALDAMSLTEVGAQAIALHSTANAGKLAAYAETHKGDVRAAVAVCLDTDDAGRKAAAELVRCLSSVGVRCSDVSAVVLGAHKDANARLIMDRQGLADACAGLTDMMAAEPQQQQQDSLARYIMTDMAADIARFGSCVCSTGFPALDAVLGGGLFAGVYAVAAVPSLGKTTLCTQIADSVAAQGGTCLYIALEQGRLDIAAKGLARTAYQMQDCPHYTALDIRRGAVDGGDIARIAAAYTQRIGDRLRVIECDFGATVQTIADEIDSAMQTGARPVVIVDYLQLLRPRSGSRATTTKDATDENITTLRQLARDKQIAIIVISSVNRGSYDAPLSMDSLKESGGIEFTCDAIIALQYDAVAKGGSGVRAAIEANSEAGKRAIDLTVLKNRNGRAGAHVALTYYPAHETFIGAGTM